MLKHDYWLGSEGNVQLSWVIKVQILQKVSLGGIFSTFTKTSKFTLDYKNINV